MFVDEAFASFRQLHAEIKKPTGVYKVSYSPSLGGGIESSCWGRRKGEGKKGREGKKRWGRRKGREGGRKEWKGKGREGEAMREKVKGREEVKGKGR